MQNLSDENLKKLICCTCKNLLSVSPIMYNSKGDYFCGRCSMKIQKLTRLELFEILAQHFWFPCQFSKFGCNKTLKWGDVSAHETVCLRRPYLCPVACPWQGSLTEIVEHMSKKHGCLIKNESRMQIKLKANKIDMGWRILLIKETKYLFCVNFNDKKKELQFALVRLKSEKMRDKYRFQLFSEDLVKEIHLPFQELHSYEMKREIKIQEGNSISQDAINYLLNKNGEFLCVIVFQSSISKQKSNDKKESSHSIPEILECPVCYNFMRAPIFQCQTGHSFCGACAPSLKECPVCKEKMLRTRNFALEDIAREHVKDCKNKSLGCNFTGFLTELGEHQESCKLIRCNAEGCFWIGQELALGDHDKVHKGKEQKNVYNKWVHRIHTISIWTIAIPLIAVALCSFFVLFVK